MTEAVAPGASFGVVFVGPRNAGKTSLYRHYNQRDFDPDQKASQGVDQCIRRGEVVNGRKRDVTLRDICGQDTYAQNMTAWHLRNMHCVVFMGDATRWEPSPAAGGSAPKTTVDDVFGLQKWVRVVKDQQPDVARVVVFNKADMLPGIRIGRDGRVEDFESSVPANFMPAEEIEAYLKAIDLTTKDGKPVPYYFTSARTGDGTGPVIQRAFELATEVVSDPAMAPPTETEKPPAKIESKQWAPKKRKEEGGCCSRS
jgi:GTPase SAR1 family protein